MRFLVEHIDDRGRQVEAGLADAWAVGAAEVALDGAVAALSADLDVRRQHGLVFVRGAVSAEAPRACERCGEPVALRVDTDLDLAYAPAGPNSAQAEAPHDLELHADELDVGWYEGDEIDLADVLREALSLALPPRVVCEDESACELRTREMLARSAPRSGHPGFAVLKNLIGT